MKPGRRKYKNRYFHYQREILNTISETAWFIDNNLQFLFVNSAFNDFFKIETDEIIRKPLQTLWENDDYLLQIEPVVTKCIEERNHKSLLFKGEIPEIGYKILEINFYPHLNRDGTPGGIIATAKDVTKHKEAEYELIQSENRLKELNSVKDKLFSIIGHDLKGLLNNILGLSELIDTEFDSFTPDELRLYNQYILRSSQTIAELLENLLTWSCAQRNILKVIPQLIPVHYVIEKSFNPVSQNAASKEISVNNNVEPTSLVFADESMLTTIIRNLFSNSIKFTNRGGNISVDAEQNNGHVIISISDDGIGITPEKMQHLFKPDKNSSAVGTEGEKGTGLGLIICKDFVERNDGKIWAESNQEDGTTFFIKLPSETNE